MSGGPDLKSRGISFWEEYEVAMGTVKWLNATKGYGFSRTAVAAAYQSRR
jgi:hypothetical protein